MLSTTVRACALFFVLVPSSFAADWPQWRGPARTGHVPQGWAVPKTLPAEPKVLWRVKAGDSLASPVVAAGKVFHVDNLAGKETVHALDAATGQEVWSKELDEAFKDAQSTAGPRCTPLFDGGRLYAQSCRGELKCFGARDGEVLWRVNYVADFGASFIGEKGQAQGAARHGYNGSPVVDGEHLITLAGGTNGAGFVCLDKTSGRVVWKSGNDPAAYAPPVIATLAGRKQAVAFTCVGLIGVDTRDGKELWRVPLTSTFSRHVTTPTVVGDTVFVSSHEWGLTAVRVTPSGSGQKAERLWTSKEAAINFASPVVVGQHLYGLGPAKNLICIDAGSGKLAWSQPGFTVADATKAHASFLVAGENLLVLTDGGRLVLVAADPKEFREIARAQVCGRTWCNPAYADGKLFARDARELVCVSLLP
jgi:outer membrane protein assembly factor BamB